MLKDIIDLSDKYTVSYIILKNDKSFHSLQKNDLLKLLSLSIFTGEKEANILQKQFPKTPLHHIAVNLGLKIKYPQDTLQEDNFFFSKYNQSLSEITINKNTIFLLSSVFNHKLPAYNFTFNIIRDIFLSHELFHHLEFIKKINLDKEFKFVNWKLGPIKFSSSPKCASEIAAFAFSQKINNISFHPKTLEYIYQIENSKIDEPAIINMLKEAKTVASSPLLNL